MTEKARKASENRKRRNKNDRERKGVREGEAEIWGVSNKIT